MGVGTSYLIGGLLKGLGAGFTNLHEEQRQNALLALKREQDVQDTATEVAAKEAARVADLAGKKEIIDYSTGADTKQYAAKAVEDRKTETIKFSNTKELERFKTQLDTQKDAASQALRARLDAGKNDVHSIEQADDGSMIIVRKDGKLEQTGVKMIIKPVAGADSGTTVADAIARRNGTAPANKPAPTAAPTAADAVTPAAQQRAAALATLGNVYHQAQKNPKAVRNQYPGLFNPDGSLKSMDEATQLINQRFAN